MLKRAASRARLRGAMDADSIDGVWAWPTDTVVDIFAALRFCVTEHLTSRGVTFNADLGFSENTTVHWGGPERASVLSRGLLEPSGALARVFFA